MTTRIQHVGWHAVLFALALSGCMQTADGEQLGRDEQSLTIDDVRTELTPGQHGPEVAAVYGYLRDYGYFPNDALAESFPYWLPVIERAPRDPSYYGPELERAVSAYQHQYGLEDSGMIDAATLSAMHAPRCGHPDNELAGLDESEKWAVRGDPLYGPTNIRWGVALLNPHASEPTTNNAILAGFNTWQPVTNRTFSFSVGTREITINFCPRSTNPPAGCPVFTGTQTRALAGFGSIAFNTTDFNWSSASEITRTATHEIGHAMGLSHSTSSNAVMFPSNSTTTLALDDRHGISVPYNGWEQVNGLALDIGAGGSSSNTAVWVTSGGNTIWKFNTSTQGFDQQFVDGSANGVSIAVSPSRIPWVVTTGNQIKRRNCEGVGDCPNVTDWSTVGTGTDIAVGGTAGNEKPWAIGATAQGGGNFQVLRWNGSSFVTPSGGGVGTRIAVDDTGRPWVRQANGSIWRRNAADNGWDSMPGCANDLGASGSLTSVYAIGCEQQGGNNTGEFNVLVWDEQGTSPCAAGTDPPCKKDWVRMDGAARRISGSPIFPGTSGATRGSIWAVQNAAFIFRRVAKPQ